MTATPIATPPSALRRGSARAAAFFCAAFAGFQAALAFGAPYGRSTWGGASAVLPANLRLASAVAAVVLAGFAGVMLVRAGDIGRRMPPRLFWALNALLGLQLALNTLGNLASRDAGERTTMAMASALGLVLCLAALWPERKPPA